MTLMDCRRNVYEVRSVGLNVVDHPRPRLPDDMRTNHGDNVVIAASHVCVSLLPVDSSPSCYLFCVLITSNSMRAILVVVYRPGSQFSNKGFSMT